MVRVINDKFLVVAGFYMVPHLSVLVMTRSTPDLMIIGDFNITANKHTSVRMIN